jgi:penicillin-binding protein 2
VDTRSYPALHNSSADRRAEGWRSSLRILFLETLVLLTFAVLVWQLWRLQIVHSAGYQIQADANRFRLVAVDAPRGVVYDRTGRILVRNVPSYSISIMPSGLPEDEADRRDVLNQLAALVSTYLPGAGDEAPANSEEIEAILERHTISPYTPVAILTAVDKQLAFLVEEQRARLPGVIIEVVPLREYLYGTLTSHILGYVGSIAAEEVDYYLDQADEDYTLRDRVGVMGVETTFERELRGVKGLKHVEVDAFEREISTLAYDPPTPGNSLELTIDLDLQRAAEDALREGMRRVGSTAGVVVASDPQTGEILAMVSLPSYDNNLFARGISYADYAALGADPERPLVNHAISGQYPPGSTFKVFPAAAALEEKTVDRNWSVRCTGEIVLPNRYFPDDPTKAQHFKCWTPYGHGNQSVVGALANSCDIYFYEVSGGFEDYDGLGLDKFNQYARAFGFGDRTGIALEGESSGLIPDDRWKRINYGEPWVTGDTYNAGIGQGFDLVTPLQLLNGTAAVANGGTLYRPQIVRRVVDSAGKEVTPFQSEVIRKVPVADSNLAIVRLGMRAAVTDGTAHRVNLAEVAVAGKTGTAEYPGPLDAAGNLPTHAWFTAFAPYENPEIALVVFVSGGHEGAKVAVPIAAHILRSYFGIPTPPGEDIVAAPPGD